VLSAESRLFGWCFAAILTMAALMNAAAQVRASGGFGHAEQSSGKHREPWLPFTELPSGAMRQELYGDPTREGAYMYVRLAAGYRLTYHSHVATERIYVDEGMLNVHVCGHPTRSASEGTAILVAGGRIHTIGCVSQRDCFFYLSLDRRFDVRWYPDIGACPD
jgi:quercetin dioxygenase-like cupin family protein